VYSTHLSSNRDRAARDSSRMLRNRDQYTGGRLFLIPVTSRTSTRNINSELPYIFDRRGP